MESPLINHRTDPIQESEKDGVGGEEREGGVMLISRQEKATMQTVAQGEET